MTAVADLVQKAGDLRAQAIAADREIQELDRPPTFDELERVNELAEKTASAVDAAHSLVDSWITDISVSRS